jgi:hypothetical protein
MESEEINTPLGSLLRVNPLDIGEPSGELRQRVEMTALVGRQDCTYPGCQLSLGHPPTHCCVWPSAVMLSAGRYQRRAGYLMIDDNGNVLREL